MQQDEEITSDELDALIGDTKTLDAARPSNASEMRLHVTVDSESLQELQQGAAAAGTDLNVAQPTPYAPAHAPSDGLHNQAVLPITATLMPRRR